jgi:hypothetical protein
LIVRKDEVVLEKKEKEVGSSLSLGVKFMVNIIKLNKSI